MKRKGRKRGPKSLLEVDPTLQKRFCESVEKNNTFKTAAAICGIGERTIFTWLEKNEAFRTAVYRARAKAKAKLVRVITNQAPHDWRAAAWILERSWPDEYARTERVEQIGEKADDK